MGMTLDLTRNVLDTYLDWHAQVLHDLHESVPFLYDNTVGDGPYNAWVDPAAGRRVGRAGLEQRGADAELRHARRIHARRLRHVESRLPDVSGRACTTASAASTRPSATAAPTLRSASSRPKSTRAPGTARIRRCPSSPGRSATTTTTKQSALLSTISYFAQHSHHFLENYYVKSKRSIQKPTLEGPAAYVIAPRRRRDAIARSSC